MASEGREPDELMREVEAWIEAEMRRLDPEAYTGAQVAAPSGAPA
jgi:1-acyl-sn-glycerol-3-phosphate acyltransferase